MNYFVSIENNYYFHWQTELLIESFKKHGLEDRLHIGIVSGEGVRQEKDIFNLSQHQNKIVSTNYGEEYGYKSINRYCGLLEALESNLIELPVALIHSDMILCDPLPDFNDDLIFSVDDSYDKLRPELESLIGDVPVWYPVGGVLIFNKNPKPFIETLIANALELKNIKLAVLCALYEHIYNYEIDGQPIESNLLHNEVKTNFIHYGKGVPPYFSKRHYQKDSILGNREGPYNALLEMTSTTNIRYIHEIINNLNARYNDQHSTKYPSDLKQKPLHRR